jgi:hypothetical protein
LPRRRWINWKFACVCPRPPEVSAVIRRLSAALTFLLATWPIIVRADTSRAAQLAARED